MTKNQIKNDIDDFFIDYVKNIGGPNYFNEKHYIRSKELYISGWLEYRDENVNFEDN